MNVIHNFEYQSFRQETFSASIFLLLFVQFLPVADLLEKQLHPFTGAHRVSKFCRKKNEENLIWKIFSIPMTNNVYIMYIYICIYLWLVLYHHTYLHTYMRIILIHTHTYLHHPPLIHIETHHRTIVIYTPDLFFTNKRCTKFLGSA